MPPVKYIVPLVSVKAAPGGPQRAVVGVIDRLDANGNEKWEDSDVALLRDWASKCARAAQMEVWHHCDKEFATGGRSG